MPSVRFTVIIPTLNEEECIGKTLVAIGSSLPSTQIIVVDGGSNDDTVKIATAHGATVIESQCGRAEQMNAGAKLSSADILIFNHADTILPASAEHDINQAFTNDVVMTAFSVKFKTTGVCYRMLEYWINNRSKLTNNYTGDQSFAISRKVFEAIGGFPQVPICEDILIVKILAAHGKIRQLDSIVCSSARRWLKYGCWHTSFAMLQARLRLLLKTPIGSIAKKYQQCFSSQLSQKNKTALGIFIKEPRPGHVKTRLAKDIGEQEAADIYKTMLDSILHIGRSACQNENELFVYVNPASATQTIGKMFGDDLQVYPQPEGDLGEKMHCYFSELFAQGFDKVLLIGSDCIDITDEIIQTAFDKLDDSSVVFGPAEDGGYYLIGMTRPQPQLFRDIQWSTATVLSSSLEKLDKSQVSYSLLSTLNDIDTLDDLKRSSLASSVHSSTTK